MSLSIKWHDRVHGCTSFPFPAIPIFHTRKKVEVMKVLNLESESNAKKANLCAAKNAAATSGMSYTWRSILAGREVLKCGLRYQIGDGTQVKLWNDPWIPLPYNFKPFSCPRDGTDDWRVANIIDRESGVWIEPVIRDLFTKTEADLILRIPLSLTNHEDCFLWHFDKKGCYNVKSGYHTYRSCTQSRTVATSSEGPKWTSGNLWNIIWRARIPPKVRSFIWRLLKGILPTKLALIKKVRIPCTSCVFCNVHEESDRHLFMSCPALRAFWNVNFVGNVANAQSSLSIFEWIYEVSCRLVVPQLELFFISLWVIWSERNNMVWNASSFDPIFMSSWASRLLEEYQRCHPPTGKKNKNKKRLNSKWECPPSGRLKINIDGAYRADGEIGGIGVVVRDGFGNCLAAFARHFPFANSAIQMEVEACKAGLLIAIQQGWDELELESDCAVLINALNSSSDDRSDFGRIVDDCKSYLNEFNSSRVRHIYREANCVAHRLAHIASLSNINEFWLNETPSIIEDVLYEDYCNCDRGSGFMSSLMHNSFHH